jgi:tRNA dimethylallyltransferase
MAAVIYLLTGSTASGKSALALAWAQARGAEILSCDALQVYRGMDIGTAKPGASERALVPHHGLDLCDPARAYSVAEYSDYAARIVAEIHMRKKSVLVVGGSGFYLKSFFAPVADGVEISPDIEAEVLALEKSGVLPALVARLRAASPAGTGTVDLRNPRRVARALARCLASGRSVPELAADFARRGTPFDAFEKRLVRLERPPAELAKRVRARTENMLRDGLVEEVKKLSEALRENPAAATAIGYRETLEWIVAGERAPLADLAEAITLRTVQLIRKQRTWFRHQLPPHQVIELSGESPTLSANLFEN